jgi:DNA-binding GntR family transcriptional regulator
MGMIALGSQVPKIAPVQLAEQVSSRLRDLIMEGGVGPGSRLIERDLAELLGVSRTPVREALFRLRDEGLASAHATRGLLVSCLSEGEIIQIYQAIAALERAALRSMRAVPARLPTELAAARAKLAACRGAKQMIAADSAWHEILTRQSPNGKLLEMLAPLRSLSRRYEYAFFSRAANVTRSLAGHEDVEARLQSGDLPGAADAIEAHWLNNLEPMRAAVAAASADQKNCVSP